MPGFARCLPLLALAVTPFLVPEATSAGGIPPLQERVIYECSADGPGTNLEICAVNPDGSDFVNLSSNAAGDAGPEFSPDGKKIAWQHDIIEIYVMNSDGSGAHPVTQTNSAFGEPTWSPDGETLAMSCNNPENLTEDGFCTIDVATGDVQFIKETAFYAVEDVAWSPDGASLLFSGEQIGTGADLYVLDLASGNITNITNTDGASEYGTWSPDGQSIAFVGQPIDDGGDDDPFANLYRIDPAGSNRELLYDPASLSPSHSAPAYSPDGKQIVWFCSDSGPGASDMCVNDANDGHLIDEVTEGQGPFRVGYDPDWALLTGPIFGDWNCSGEANTEDVSLVLEHLSGVNSAGNCVALGSSISVNGVHAEWGDYTCDANLDGADALAGLKAEVGLDEPQNGCPFIGTIADIQANT